MALSQCVGLVRFSRQEVTGLQPSDLFFLYHKNRTGPESGPARRLTASTEGASHAPPRSVLTICCGRLLAHEWKEERRSSINQAGTTSLIAL